MHEPNNVKGKSHVTNCVKAAPVGQKCKMKKCYSEKKSSFMIVAQDLTLYRRWFHW